MNDRERIYDLFGLSPEERQWIEDDTDGWQAARAEADRQQRDFVAYVRHVAATHGMVGYEFRD